MKKILAATAIALAFTAPAHATLTLTAQGLAAGFSLTTFASEPSFTNNYPFLSAAVLSDGNLAVVDFANRRLLKMADVDNQTFADVLSSVSFSGAINIATVNGHTYAASQSTGFWEVSASLGLTHINTPGVLPNLGLWANPVTGHLLAATNLGITDIDPITGVSTVINGAGADGISISPDGSVVYAEVGGIILGFNIATHAQVFDSGAIAGNPDGTGVISGGALNGHIIVNNNNGTVIEIDPNTHVQTVIASGGTRGDFTAADANNGSLLLSEYGAMYRLAIQGGTIGGGTVPEPTSFALAGLALFGLVLSRRKAA